MSDAINTQQAQETKEAIDRFASLAPDKQQAALLILHGIQIGESIAADEQKGA